MDGTDSQKALSTAPLFLIHYMLAQTRKLTNYLIIDSGSFKTPSATDALMRGDGAPLTADGIFTDTDQWSTRQREKFSLQDER